MTTKQERALAAHRASAHPIKLCLEPMKKDAQDHAAVVAGDMLERMRQELEAAGNDIDKVAPRPRGDERRTAYLMAQHRRASFDYVTVLREKDRYLQRGEPRIVDMCPDRMGKFVADARWEAAQQYDLYVMKLCHKCGDGVVGASIWGNHIWSESFLTVVLQDGEKQVWKTQTIQNVSVLGKPFLQWPTRLIKTAR